MRPRWVGGWVGGWVVEWARKGGEDEAVLMRCWGLGLGGWVG